MGGNIKPVKDNLNIEQLIKQANANKANIDKKPEPKKPLFFNGEIEPTWQGKNGDCWLLAGVNALNTTDWGREAISETLKNAKKPDSEGNFHVKLKGSKLNVDTFKISVDEFCEARESGYYSSGDDDMIMIELAVEKYRLLSKGLDMKLNNGSSLIGGYSPEVMRLIAGDDINTYFVKKSSDLDKLTDLISEDQNKYAMICNFSNDNDPRLSSSHAYTIISIDKKEVILSNPWHSYKKIKISYEDFRKNFGSLTINSKDKDERFSPYIPKKNTFEEDLDLARKINLNIRNKDDNALKKAISQINEDNIMTILEVAITQNVIADLDSYKFGWGNGKEKKALIEPIINALAERAAEVGVDSQKIAEFEKICIKQELNAKFYTSGKTIQAEIDKMRQLIKNADSSP